MTIFPRNFYMWEFEPNLGVTFNWLIFKTPIFHLSCVFSDNCVLELDMWPFKAKLIYKIFEKWLRHLGLFLASNTFNWKFLPTSCPLRAFKDKIHLIPHIPLKELQNWLSLSYKEQRDIDEKYIERKKKKETNKKRKKLWWGSMEKKRKEKKNKLMKRWFYAPKNAKIVKHKDVCSKIITEFSKPL